MLAPEPKEEERATAMEAVDEELEGVTPPPITAEPLVTLYIVIAFRLPLSPMEERREETMPSMLLRTVEGSVLRVTLKPMKMLFWHLNLSRVNPVMQLPHRLLFPLQVRQGERQARHWEASFPEGR